MGLDPTICAYAPGRVEILGNHTDYNEGFVLSCAIDLGMAFAVGPSGGGGRSTLVAVDLKRSNEFRTAAPSPLLRSRWANYSKGVLHFLSDHAAGCRDFTAVFGGDIPSGAGLSSSAALEMATGLALAEWLGVEVPALEMARIGQRAEAEFAGVQCGLLDQITCLFGRVGFLVHTDFRTLGVTHARIPDSACFLLCNTEVRHSLVDSAYNERRSACATAVAGLAGGLGRSVRALRDVTMDELRASERSLDPAVYRRALHVVGENDRVQCGVQDLLSGDIEAFGRRMTESHDSSRLHFENSCPELDDAVRIVNSLEGVQGARLSGGGFGGSVVALVAKERAETVAVDWQQACSKRWGRPISIRRITPSGGARNVRLDPAEPSQISK
jgi:galactokinase